MSNKENRIKSLPDVFYLASLVQFKYIQDISRANDTNFKVSMAGDIIRLFHQANMTIMDKYLTWLEKESLDKS